MILKSRYGVLAVFAAIVWCSAVWYRIQQPSTGGRNHDDETKAQKEWTKDDWIEANVQALEDQDWDEKPLTELCAETTWRDDLVFECSQIDGGIANVRNEFLSCLRYAISSGASIILPSIYTSQQARTSQEDAALGLSHFFNETLFLSRLNTSCPKLRIYSDMQELENAGPVLRENQLHPSNLPHFSSFPVTSVRNHVWKLADTNMGAITLIPFGPVTSYYPICNDDAKFANAFGSLLPFSRPLLHLASAALWTMQETNRLHLEPEVVSTDTSDANKDDHSTWSQFWGIHLPTYDDDLINELDYGRKRKQYFSRMKSMKSVQILIGGHKGSLPVYLASEKQTGPAMFAEGSASVFGQPLYVMTKESLLEKDDLEELAKLSWDQQAVVDYLVLLRSRYFLGTAESSFSWAVGVKRRSRSSKGSCGGQGWWWAKGWFGGSAMRDELSEVVGRQQWGQERCLWP